MAVFDIHMNYLFASSLWYQHYNILEDDILGMNHYAIFPEILEKPEWMDVHKRVLQGETFSQPHDEFLRGDGTTQYIRWSMQPWFLKGSEQQGGAVLYSEDVTEQRKTTIENERLVDELKHVIAQKDEFEQMLIDQAFTDPLTGLYNRRYFLEACADEVIRSNRYDMGFSIMLVDIDHFKKVNDSFGHNEGDNVLKHITKILLSIARKSDVCARWGGEEFIVLMPNTSLESALKLGERFRLQISVEKFPKVEHITISAGISCHSKGKSTIDCINEADKALYQAKDLGRNRVCTFDTFE
jgi:diguanylate cyclase (GGDEF)-like protein